MVSCEVESKQQVLGRFYHRIYQIDRSIGIFFNRAYSALQEYIFLEFIGKAVFEILGSNDTIPIKCILKNMLINLSLPMKETTRKFMFRIRPWSKLAVFKTVHLKIR